MKSSFVVLALALAGVALLASSAGARNPGGRDYGGAIFSAGGSGTDGSGRGSFGLATPALDALVRVSDDSGLPDTLAPWELNQSGRAFINSETEPWVDVNPANAMNLVGFFQEDRWSTGGARNVTFATSMDGGQTWSNIPAPGLTRHYGGPYERATDPWVEFGPGNRVYATDLGFDDTSPASGIFVHVSTDGGLTWSAPIALKTESDFAFFNDRNSLAVDDFPGSPFYGSVYVGWDRLASKGPGYAYTGDGLVAFSRDGLHYTNVRAVPTGNNEQTLTNLPVVEPDGTVVLVGTYYQNQSFNKNGGKFFVTSSSDGGVSWDPVRFPFDQKPVGIPDIRSGDGVPNATVDRRNGKLYAVWQDSRFSGGKRDDVLLVSSNDEGRTWSAPIKVNDTPAGAQGAFLPTVKVDANGRVGVFYYDLRNDVSARDASLITTAWIAFSTDGGRTFAPSRRLAPDFDHTNAAFAGGFFLGDYEGLGVSGSKFMPFFGATLEPQADGRIGSDIFFTKVR
jgi:BNR/Asp-box repeat